MNPSRPFLRAEPLRAEPLRAEPLRAEPPDHPQHPAAELHATAPQQQNTSNAT